MRNTILSFLLCYYCVYLSLASAKCLQDQQSFLLQLKNNFTFNLENSTRLKLWNKTIACCNWSGVTCDNEGHIIGLDLSYEFISNGFDDSSSLFNLLHLQKLNLAYNQFNSPIPSRFSKLKNLSVIILDGNNFSCAVPETFANFKNLTTLILSNCGLMGTFPQKIFQIETLSVIDLSLNYNLHGSFPDYSMSESLRSITVSSTNFYGTLPNSIGNLKKLSTLDLFYCQFNGTLPYSLSNLTHLTYLDLSYNNFSGPVKLDRVLALRNLTTLDLSYNNLSINVSVANVDLSSIPNFTILRLASCNLKTFPSFLINQSTLISLDLSNNQIRGKIPNWIWKLQDLINFNISHNFLTNLEGPFQNNTSNRFFLDLHNNKLHGSIPILFKSVSYLDYSSNKFSVMPQNIGNYISSAIFISFSNNNLHGSIPDSLCNATQLEVLDISFNNLSGMIPPCLMTMTGNLQVLDMRKNSLIGPIPDMFSNSCAVSRLNFHGNLLDGPVPKSLSHCSSLEILDIGSNQIVDHFPCFLNNISALLVLVLRNNKFYGSVECSHLVKNKPWKMIQIMDIAFNNFDGKLSEKYFITWERMKLHEDGDVSDLNLLSQGPINPYYKDSVTITCKGQPREWVRILKILKAIDFSSNFFDGPIPESLTELKVLYILNFSNNGLTGKIPSSIGNLKELESLDLANNYLVGEIPVSLANLSFLSYLNLSFNHLVGKIPTGTQLQSFQASSFEGNDGLYGPPLIEKKDGERKVQPQPTCGRLICSIDWNFLSVELGFVFGLGMIIGPIMFWKKWRVGYWKLSDKILCKIFPWMRLEYETHRGQTYTVLKW